MYITLTFSVLLIVAFNDVYINPFNELHNVQNQYGSNLSINLARRSRCLTNKECITISVTNTDRDNADRFVAHSSVETGPVGQLVCTVVLFKINRSDG